MAREEVNQITEKAFTGVKASEYTVIDAGVYNATLTSFSDVRQGMNGEYVFWNFTPDGHDTEVSIITSIGGGWKSKGMEIARRLKGKSDATDTKWGRDIRDKRPRVDWGPELVGSRATIVVEKHFDEDEEVHRNRVTNVVAEGALKPVEEAEAEDFESIPF
jgi:hypothetical protein